MGIRVSAGPSERGVGQSLRRKFPCLPTQGQPQRTLSGRSEQHSFPDRWLWATELSPRTLFEAGRPPRLRAGRPHHLSCGDPLCGRSFVFIDILALFRRFWCFCGVFLLRTFCPSVQPHDLTQFLGRTVVRLTRRGGSRTAPTCETPPRRSVQGGALRCVEPEWTETAELRQSREGERPGR
jgi:hypothetical protein